LIKILFIQDIIIYSLVWNLKMIRLILKIFFRNHIIRKLFKKLEEKYSNNYKYQNIKYKIARLCVMNGVRPPFIYYGNCDSLYWQTRNLETNHSPEQYLRTDFSTQATLDKIINVSNKDTSFIEIGYNAGRNLNYLLEKGFKKLAGIEINEIAINQTLKQNFSELYKTAKFYIGNAAVEIKKIPDNSFDVVFSIAVLIHIDPEFFSFFADMVRISKKYIAIFTAENGAPFPYNFRKIFTDLGCKEIYYQSFYGDKIYQTLPTEKYDLKKHFFNETFVRIFIK